MAAHISIPTDHILKQLTEIQNSPLFENKNRLKRFLSYVVNESLSGNAHLIKGYTLGLEVFDKDENFERANVINHEIIKTNPK